MKYILVLLALPLCAQTVDQLEAHNVGVSSIEYQGKRAVRLEAKPDAADGESYAVLKGARFHNGTIEVSLAGKPAANAGAGARGYIGIAYRLQGSRYEYIYLRPTNGRADEQVRRNHSTQYGAHPDYGFGRMRKDFPREVRIVRRSKTGVWTRYRIVIDGPKARLYVNGAPSPAWW